MTPFESFGTVSYSPSIVTMASISYHFGDKERYRPKIAIFSYPLALDAPVRGSPSEHCNTVCCGKTKMVWLPDGNNVSGNVYPFRQNTAKRPKAFYSKKMCSAVRGTGCMDPPRNLHSFVFTQSIWDHLGKRQTHTCRTQKQYLRADSNRVGNNIVLYTINKCVSKTHIPQTQGCS